MSHATHKPNSKDRSSLKIGLCDKFRTRENTTNPVIEIPKKNTIYVLGKQVRKGDKIKDVTCKRNMTLNPYKPSTIGMSPEWS